MHCDLKPDNICVKESSDRFTKSREYMFSLIDFGLIRKVKLGKILQADRGYKGGNKLFASVRALKGEQVRY